MLNILILIKNLINYKKLDEKKTNILEKEYRAKNHFKINTNSNFISSLLTVLSFFTLCIL